MSRIIGTLYIISAPSGAGKTSLVNALIQELSHLKLSVSHTTRAPRPKEVDGYNYHFIDQATFKQMQKNGDFMESAEVFGNFYGTSEQAVKKMLEQGSDVILEIDWQGAEQIKARFKDAISIFILPPDIDTLQERLEVRAEDSQEIIALRMSKAKSELKHWHKADYLVVNDDFEQALEDLQAIIKVNRLSTPKQQAINHLLLKKLNQ